MSAEECCERGRDNEANSLKLTIVLCATRIPGGGTEAERKGKGGKGGD
jgi:hypothetical protein